MSGRRPLGATELIALGVGVGYAGQTSFPDEGGTMTTTASVPRPVGVTIVSVITFVQGFFAVLGGLALIVERNNNDLIAQVDQTSGRITTYAVAAIVWGAIAFLVALRLWNGADWARIVIGILQVVNIAAGIYLLLAWGGTYLWQGIWQIGIALAVLYFLFDARGSKYFYSRD
jgi:hypothetical protein